MLNRSAEPCDASPMTEAPKEIPMTDEQTATDTQHYAWVTLGYNGLPSYYSPADATKELGRALSKYSHLVTEAETVGEWQGVSEHGHAWLISFDNAHRFTKQVDGRFVTGNAEEWLRATLTVWASLLDQEAIGFVGTCGGETLVTP